MKTIELTYSEIIRIAEIGAQHGSEVIETYLLGDRSQGERLWVWNAFTDEWKDVYVYPWFLEHPHWDSFYIGNNPNEDF